ncbi:MAG: ZIP family metal transporter [Pseudomonadota bacterium]
MLVDGTITAIGASLFAAVISGIGLISMALFGDVGRRYSPYISAFAVGVLLTSTLFHLLPEGYLLSDQIWQWVAAGFFGFLGFGLLLRIVTSGQAFETDLTFAFSSAVALGTHSLLDGVLYATAFQGDGVVGWLSVLGLWVHEFPEGVIIYYLLREANLSSGVAMMLAFLTACVSTLVGTVATLSFLDFFSTSLAAMMGITAGAFFYIMIFHLGPHAADTPNKRGYLAASVGVVLTIAAILVNHAAFHHHGHDHGAHSGEHDH